MRFDGFISYSHAADGRLAPAVQRGLHQLARPWHRRRALWIFRDQTGLAVTPALWSSIQNALDASDYFVLLASPEAAASPWVNREIEHWIATRSADRILPVVTDGEWNWDAGSRDFTENSSAVPVALRGVFAEEPLFLDLRWARDDEHLSLRHSRFRDAIAQLAAPMHRVSKDDLEGEDVRQYRRARRLFSAGVTALVVLALIASLAGVLAVRNADRANEAVAAMRRQQQLTLEQQQNAEQSAVQALMLGFDAHQVWPGSVTRRVVGVGGGDRDAIAVTCPVVAAGLGKDEGGHCLVHGSPSILQWHDRGIWYVADRAHPVRIATLPNALFSSITFSPDGRALAIKELDGNTTFWDVTDRSQPVRLGALPGVRAVTFGGNQVVAVSNTDGSASIFTLSALLAQTSWLIRTTLSLDPPMNVDGWRRAGIEGALWTGRIGVAKLLSLGSRGHLAGEITP